MSREIKFRAWGKNSHEYLRDIDNFYRGFSIKELGYIEHLEEWELMQYTGLTDKAGKEIYEGDFLQWEDWQQELTEKPDIYVAAWLSEAAKFVLKCYRGGLYLEPQDISFRSCKEFEVIGNLYENPELLKENK